MATYQSLAASLMGRRAIREYPFPTLENVMVGVRMLTDEELDQVRLQAAQFCKTKNVDAVLDPEFLDRVIQRLVILHAFFDVEKKQDKFFRSHDEVAQLDQFLMRTLYELYCAHVQSMDPLSYATAEEVETMVAQLGKSEMSVARLSLFDRRTLLSYVLSMASLLRATQPTPK